MKIDEKTFKAMPLELQALFLKCQNPGSEEVVGLFPSPHGAGGAVETTAGANPGIANGVTWQTGGRSFRVGDSGSAARFFKNCPDDDLEDAEARRLFYSPKASKSDRNEGLEDLEEEQQDLSRKEGNPGGDNPRNRGLTPRKNNHPTVKPHSLMKYLVRLITPPDGVVLDPFMGSGSTGKACMVEGFNFIGFELDEHYLEIAEKRIVFARDNAVSILEDGVEEETDA